MESLAGISLCLIRASIYHPTSVPSTAVRPAVTIYFPRGPILSDHIQDVSNVSLLSSALRCPVVKINYRCDQQSRFPTPIYDMMAGYDWIRQNLLPKRSITRAGRSERVGVIATCGELVGGQLATVLALTECQVDEPGIVAAAVNNPIVDWVSFQKDVNGISRDAPLSSSDLLRKRDELFRKPEGYFDTFASPIHFFRTAGERVPPSVREQPMDDMEELALSERADLGDSRLVAAKAVVEDSDIITEFGATRSPRKASLRYPSVAFRLRLPDFHIAAGEHSPMLDQAREFANQLRRSPERQVKANRDASEVTTSDTVHGERLHLHQSPGLGLWDNTDAGRTRLFGVARWIAERVER